MPRAVSVQLGRSGSISIGAQGLIIIVFLAILIYVLVFSGDDDKIKAPPTSQIDGGASAQEESVSVQPEPEEPSIPATPTPSAAASDESVPIPSPADHFPQIIPSAEPIRESHPSEGNFEPFPVDPSGLRKLDQKIRPFKSSIMNRPPTPIGSTKPRSLSFTDQDGNGTPLHRAHSDDILAGNHTEEAWQFKGTSHKAPEFGRPKAVNFKVNDRRPQDLLDGKIPNEILQDLIKIDSLVRGDPRAPPPKPVSSRKSDDTQPAIKMDPTRDEWDEVWGPLPTMVLFAINSLVSLMPPDFAKTMKQSAALLQKIPRDSKRDWSIFGRRAQPNLKDGEEIDTSRILLGWFADHYRCVNGSVRVTVPGDVPEVTQMMGDLVVSVLKWLECLGHLCRRFRVFTAQGLDLHGFAARLSIRSIPGRGRSTPGAPAYTYELSLTVFLWEIGPREKDPSNIGRWLARAHESAQALTSARLALNSDLIAFDDWLDLDAVGSTITFRPGYSKAKANQWLTSKPRENAYDPNAVYRAAVERKPIVYRYSSDPWADLPSEIQNRCGYYLAALVREFPVETVALFNLRQFQWVTSDITPLNSTLTKEQVLLILYVIGPYASLRSQTNFTDLGEWDVTTLSTIKRIDFGSFVPTADKEGGFRAFFPLSDFRALWKIIIPYVDGESSSSLTTAKLLCDRGMELQGLLESRQVLDRGQMRNGYLTICITVRNQRQLREMIRSIQDMLINMAEKTFQDAKPTNGEGWSGEEFILERDKARAAVESLQLKTFANVRIHNLEVHKKPNQGSLQGVDDDEPLDFVLDWSGRRGIEVTGDAPKMGEKKARFKLPGLS